MEAKITGDSSFQTLKFPVIYGWSKFANLAFFGEIDDNCSIDLFSGKVWIPRRSNKDVNCDVENCESTFRRQFDENFLMTFLGEIESIPPTFWAQLFWTNNSCAAFLYLHFWFVLFWQEYRRKRCPKNFGEIDTCLQCCLLCNRNKTDFRPVSWQQQG